MTRNPSIVDLVNDNMNEAKNYGIGQVSTDPTTLEGTTVSINDKLTSHFGSCSYLNLELDERLKNAAIEAIKTYGTQFSASRAYIAVPLYEELEQLLTKIFGGFTIVSPTTTLGHVSNVPLLVDKNDAIILDHQVHNSVQNAARLAASAGTHVEMCRHNNLDTLERRILKLQERYNKVWYFADGIYSMYGDACPVKDLYQLMDKYESLHLYIDDAHGMSWAGKNGAGYILSEVDLHPRMVLVTSLCKGFASAGGATIFYDEETARKIRNCGASNIFSGPLQPAMLAAGIASAKIHLSDEINDLQAQLMKNIAFFQRKVIQYKLPLVNFSPTPIQYIGIGKLEVAMTVCKRLMEEGYYTCIAGYPSVPINNAGVRITINRLHTKQQIVGLLSTLARIVKEELEKANLSESLIYKAFKLTGTIENKSK